MIPRLPAVLAAALIVTAPVSSQDEVILQYFNTSWKEIERRIPEVAEAGYSALWLPPPCKAASGGFSVGYDVFDRFDLGDKNQMGGVPTRYGTKAELLRLVEVAHRFGLRVYFDNVMAHTGGPLDNVPAGTLFPSMRGFVPEDFHLVRAIGRRLAEGERLHQLQRRMAGAESQSVRVGHRAGGPEHSVRSGRAAGGLGLSEMVRRPASGRDVALSGPRSDRS